MRKWFVYVLVLAFIAMLVAGCAHSGKTEESEEYPGIVRGNAAVITATVTAIDLKNRIVTLDDGAGNLRDFKVGKEAVNLPQVKVGDIVTIKFLESIAVEVIKPGTAAGAGEKTTIVRAKPGEMPGGMVTSQKVITATVKAIDKTAGTISLMGPDGKTVKVKAQDPSNLDKVNVGDDLMITYTEAKAISVTRPAEP